MDINPVPTQLKIVAENGTASLAYINFFNSIRLGALAAELTKATGTDVDTGTDDAKYVTVKAINDSHTVPLVTPGPSGNVLTSNGTDWESSTPSGHTQNTDTGTTSTTFQLGSDDVIPGPKLANSSGNLVFYLADGTTLATIGVSAVYVKEALGIERGTTAQNNWALAGAAICEVFPTPHDNISIGKGALSTYTGANNNALGYYALHAFCEGASNNAFGCYALTSVTTGAGNLGLGGNVATGLTTGTYNICIGNSAATGLIDGDYNVIIGGYSTAGCGQNIVSGNKNIIIGPGAGPTADCSDQLFIHNGPTDTPLIHGNFATLTVTINGNFNQENTTNASQFGAFLKAGDRFIHNFNYGDNSTVITEGYNTFLGVNAGNFTMGSGATETYHSSYNTATGAQALLSNTIGYNNTADGMYALGSNTTGWQNTASGLSALGSNTTGYDNTANGTGALIYNTEGYQNTAVGVHAGGAPGDGSEQQVIADTNLVLLGFNATKNNVNAIDNSIAIGAEAQVTKSNQVVLGNSSIEETVLRGNIIIAGGFTGKITNATDTYTVLTSDETVICNKATSFTVTLFAATTATIGQKITIKNIGAGTVTVDGDSTDTIDGSLTQTLNQWESIQLQCYAANSWGVM